MRAAAKGGEKGFTLVEIVVVTAILAALASIAIPHYVRYQERARETECLSNRRNIETDEAGRFAQEREPYLLGTNDYRCPSGGVYVWLASDPEDSRYPQVACSVHFAPPSDETGDASDDSPPSPLEAIDDLMEDIRNLDLPRKVERRLLKNLKKAKKRYEKSRVQKSDDFMDAFEDALEKNSDSLPEEDASAMREQARDIRDQLQRML